MQEQSLSKISSATRAIIVATRELPTELNVMSDRYPSVLLPLMDKPFIQHVLESLVSKGIERFDVLASHLPDRIRALLGDGQRWGVSIRHHLVKEPRFPYRTVGQIATSSDNGMILLVHGDCWPHIDCLGDNLQQNRKGVELYYGLPLLTSDSGDEMIWSGWALLEPDYLSGLPHDADQRALCDFLNNLPGANKVIINRHPLLSVRSIGELFRSHYSVLKKQRTDFRINANEAGEGIWLARNVSLHPNVQLNAPVYIGENCSIGKGVHLGPHAVIGSDCVLSEHSMVKESIIFSGSFIGENLELDQTLVDKNCMVNQRLNAELIVTETFILSSLTKREQKSISSHLLTRLLAAFLLLCFSPWLMFLWLWNRFDGKNYAFRRQPFVRLPAESDPLTWRIGYLFSFEKNDNELDKTELRTEELPSSMTEVGLRDFFFRVIPSLVNVVSGELCLVGVAPRSEDQIKSLPSDWRSLYLKCKPGIITESLLNFGLKPSLDHLYSADAIYSVSAGVIYDAKLLGRYLLQLIGLESVSHRL